MKQPIDIDAFSNPLHDIAKAAFALAASLRALPGDGNEGAAFQALVMARLIAAAHEVSQAGGAPDKHFGQAHYAYRNAVAFAQESLHMMNSGGELLALDRAFHPAPPRTRTIPVWWENFLREI